MFRLHAVVSMVIGSLRYVSLDPGRRIAAYPPVSAHVCNQLRFEKSDNQHFHKLRIHDVFSKLTLK